MSDIVIRAEGIGKSYLIGHNSNERYVALRDVIANKTKEWWSKIRSPHYNIQKNIEEFWALKDVSFEVKQGERIGIIGRNGAGKSTLLKILSRITEPTTGRVSIKGRVASLLEVGTGFHRELTGRENIYLNGAILGMTRAEIKRKFDEIVDFSEVEKFLDTPAKRYSSGMYVRLAFAVAAHLEPEILVVDEVLAVGDASFQRKCLGKMSDVAQEGRTVLFVSHNMGAIASLCGRCVLLNEGKIKISGETSSVISDYLQGNKDLPISDSLINHPNRAKGFKQLLTRFMLQADNEVVYYGKPLVFRIGYSFPEGITVPQFCASFHNENGLKVFTLISDYQTNDIPVSLQGEGEIICRIKSVPLLPGNYFINLRLWQPGEKFDDIENVARFRVEWLERDIGQFNWDSSLGEVYVDAEWHWNGKAGK
jgi:lipopolysaccharide transport system ATP-binding protein